MQQTNKQKRQLSCYLKQAIKKRDREETPSRFFLNSAYQRIQTNMTL